VIEMPESDKLIKNAPVSQEIGAFVDWLREKKGWVLAEYKIALDPEVRFEAVEVSPGVWQVKDLDPLLGSDTYLRGRYTSLEGAEEAAAYRERRRRARAQESQEPRLFDVNPSMEELLAEYFEIDLTKVETERRALLDELAARPAGPGDDR
jgi:hypothetical protein